MPAAAAGDDRYSSHTVSSLMPGWTWTWWQVAQNPDCVMKVDWMAVWCIRIHRVPSASSGLSGSSGLTRIWYSIALLIAFSPPVVSKGPNTGSWMLPGVIRRAALVLP
jgi:hypothetical protein